MSIQSSVIAKPKKPASIDWHPADVIAALWKLGTSLQRIAREHRYHPTSLNLALRKPWPKAERIIADVIGTPVQEIWPSRYHSDGTPKSGRGERGLGRYKGKDSTSTKAVNVHERKVA